MLDSAILDQVRGVFADLESSFVFRVTRDAKDEQSAEFSAFVEDVASCSDKISTEYHDGEGFSFSLVRNGEETGIRFRGIPNGHEFTSLLLAVLNAVAVAATAR
jgi:alkyl hydroperoxide reductase subunit F